MRLIPRSRRVRRALAIAAIALIVLVCVGAVYQAISVRRERAQFPPPGRFVGVGGRRLHVICAGAGSPAVIFEPSMFGGSMSSRLAREEIARHTRVCSYDRMGMGWSDGGPSVISIGLLATDLERMLAGAGVPPPYVLVPSSIGGLTAELFARRHPDQVAGLILLDAAQSDGLARLMSLTSGFQRTAASLAACLQKPAASIGLLRVIDPWGFRARGDARAAASLYRPEAMNTFCGMVRGLSATVTEFASAPPLRPDVPLTVLSAETTDALLPAALASYRVPMVEERLPLAQAFSRRSTRGQWRVVPGSNHLIGNSQPQAVVDAVLEMLRQIRGS